MHFAIDARIKLGDELEKAVTASIDTVYVAFKKIDKRVDEQL